MPPSVPLSGSEDLPGLEKNKPAVSGGDPVFEMAPGARHEGAAKSAAISEDFGAQLHAAQERLLELRQQQETLERQQEDLTDLQHKQDRFLRGRVDIVERLNKGLNRLDRETFQTRKRAEMLEHAKENFSTHLDTIEGFNPEHWSREDLRSELVKATAALEDAEQDYAEAMGRLALHHGDEPLATSGDPLVRGAGSWPPLRYWLLAGLAFTLPVVTALVILIVLQIMP